MALSVPPKRERPSQPEPERVLRRNDNNLPLPTEKANKVIPLSSQQLLDGGPCRELILLGGKDGVGKSCAIISTAAYVEATSPEAKFYLIDSENKIRSTIRGFGADAPKNIVYYKVDNMNQVTESLREVLEVHRPGDWLGVESMSRIWERAQDLGYTTVTGMGKALYMERRREAMAAASTREEKRIAVTPQPDQLWSITKGAHDGAFLDPITQCDDLNFILSTILSRPPKADAFIKENMERKAFRAEFGIDVGLEGAPRLPYYMETLCLLDLKNGQVTCRILRDNLSVLDYPKVEFVVDNRKTWATDFWANCR